MAAAPQGAQQDQGRRERKRNQSFDDTGRGSRRTLCAYPVGLQEEATQKTNERLASSGRSSWQKEILEFVADPDMEPKELLNAIKGNCNRVVAHKVIAFRHLSRGEVRLAQDHLEKSQQACPLQPDAYWAGAFLSRLQTDTAWCERLEKNGGSQRPGC